MLGDLLRPTLDDRPGGVDKQIAWLFHAFRRQITTACGLDVRLLTTQSDPELAALLTRLRPKADAKRYWAQHFRQAPAELEGALAKRLQGRYCVCYEMPPFLGEMLDRLGVQHIDLRVHPVRFMDDLLFAVRSSDPQVQHRLMQDSVSEAEVTATIGLREAMLDLVQPAQMPPDTLLVLGQQKWDASQIVGDGFFDPTTRHDIIERLCTRHRHVVIKPHPNGADGPLIDLIRSLRPDAAVATDNIYRLLACPDVAAVLSVNSSVALEAELFGKPSHTLAPQPFHIGWRGDTGGTDLHASIDDRFLTADFWRVVLAPYTPVSALDGQRLPSKPNRLRLALGAFWNYQQIDTDLIPRATPPSSLARLKRVVTHRGLQHAGRSLAAALSALSALTTSLL